MKTVDRRHNGVSWKCFAGKGERMPVIELSDHVDAWVLIEEKRYADPKKYPIISHLTRYRDTPIKGTDPIYGTEKDHYLFEFGKQDTKNATGQVQWMKPRFVGYFCDIYQENGENKEICILSLPKITDQSILEESNRDGERSCKTEFETLMKLLYRYRRELIGKDALFRLTTFDPANELTLANRLGELYLRNGPYTVAETEENIHSGVCLWGRTVSGVHPDVILDDTGAVASVYYPRVIKKRLRRRETEITQIQKAVLNHLFYDKHYSSVLLIQPQVEKSIYSIGQLKGDGYILNRLREEQLHTFSDDDWEMLELLIRFLSDGQKADSRKIYAITKYENLFETILGEYWGTQLSIDRRREKQVDISFRSEYPTIGRIPDINCDALNPIQWNIGKAAARRTNNKNISIPDIVLDFQDQAHCVIIDAKYYQIEVTDRDPSQTVTGHPGRDDVLKQLHYEEIFRHIYRQKKLDLTFTNIFAVPLTKTLGMAGAVTLDDGLLSLVGTVDVNYGAETKKIRVVAVDMDQLVPKILEGRSHVRNNRKALLDIRTIR